MFRRDTEKQEYACLGKIQKSKNKECRMQNTECRIQDIGYKWRLMGGIRGTSPLENRRGIRPLEKNTSFSQTMNDLNLK